MANGIKFNILPNMIFPSTKMESVNKLITEGNLTRLINKLIDTDSYLIPPTNINLDNYTNTDYGLMIEASEVIEEDIEFMLHGYYFNLGSIKNLVDIAKSKAILDSTITDFIITAQIMISMDYANNNKYPELFGEDLIQQTIKKPFPTSPTISESELPRIPDELLDKPISKILFSHVTPTGEEFLDGEGSYDSNNIILKPAGLIFDVTCDYFYTIEYKDYSSMITLYVNSPSVTSQVLDNTSTYVLPQDVQTYTLNLLMFDSNTSKIYMPITNFAKFGHQSISSLDGGEF